MHRFEPIGGALALDFVNTVAWRTSDAPQERLESESDLREWAKAAGVGPLPSKLHPGDTAETLASLRAFREVLNRLFAAYAAKRRPRPADVAAFNRALGAAPERRKLSPVGSRFVWHERERPAPTAFDRIRDAVARSAAFVLTEREPEAVRLCEGEGCGWFFLDESRHRKRRWCSMGDCGNRAKAKRHYARTKRRSARRR